MQATWQNIMINSNKFIVSIAGLYLSIASAYAGKAVLFDQPNLIGFRDGEVVSGFYDGENAKFSCLFFFFQNGRESQTSKATGYTETKLSTFAPGENSFEFSNRDRTFDIDGNLYRRENEWIVKTATAQAGCENATGTFTFDPNDFRATSYYSEKEIPAIGICLVKEKSYLYDYHDGKFTMRKGYLTKWNGVIVLQTHDQFSLVRFADPRMNVENPGRITTGWVHSADLVNPFPAASKQ
ncbi:hypothetical protein OKW45_002040 [Paraburkholderia sp. WSM4175]|uniref:hypothetical protein n=1 Tax=Paraburkholderia sp. WSM4175 TaxID=2991072 RepID=UPI003D2156E1